MAGFRTIREDSIDAALRNWALWYLGFSSGNCRIVDLNTEVRSARQGALLSAYEEQTVVTWVEGWAMDTDVQLGILQAEITHRMGADAWKVRETVKCWYAGTGTDEYEAEGLRMARTTFIDRIRQVKRWFEGLKDEALLRRA
jgi:hypothetical protein